MKRNHLERVLVQRMKDSSASTYLYAVLKHISIWLSPASRGENQQYGYMSRT